MKTRNVLPTISISLLGFAVIFIFLHFEQKIYSWDYRGYWVQYMDLGKLAVTSPRHFIDSIRESVQASDYNNLIVAIPALLTVLTGDSREAFLASLFVIYFIPFSLLFGHFASNFAEKLYSVRLSPLAYSLLSLSCMPIWTTLLRGEPDVAGMIAMVLAVGAIFNLRADQVYLGRALLIGLSIWAAFLARRWYAFGVMPIALCAPLLTIYLTVSERKCSFGVSLLYCAINYLIAGSIAVLLVLSLQYDLVLRILSTSYGDIYDAYQRELPFHLLRIYSHFGIFPIVLALLGLVLGLRNRSARPYFIYALVCCLSTYIAFIRTQQFENHHFLMISFWLLFFQAIGLSAIAKLDARGLVKLVIIYSTVVFALPWVVVASGLKPFVYVIPSAVQPMRVENYNEYKRLVDDLVAFGDVRIAVIGSGKNFNDSMMMSLSDEKLVKRFIAIPHVDKMHGFMPEPFSADYIVLSSPVATHLPRGQEVLRIYSESFSNFANDGTYSQVGSEYKLSGGMIATVFKRNFPVSREQIKSVLEKIYAVYPDWRERYENSLLLDQLFSKVKLGDKWGFVRFDTKNNRIELHPGQTTPTSFTLGTGRKMAVALVRPCGGSDGVFISIDGDDDHIKKSVTTTTPIVFDTSKFSGSEMTITVSNNANPTCDHTYVEVAR